MWEAEYSCENMQVVEKNTKNLTSLEVRFLQSQFCQQHCKLDFHPANMLWNMRQSFTAYFISCTYGCLSSPLHNIVFWSEVVRSIKFSQNGKSAQLSVYGEVHVLQAKSAEYLCNNFTTGGGFTAPCVMNYKPENVVAQIAHSHVTAKYLLTDRSERFRFLFFIHVCRDFLQLKGHYCGSEKVLLVARVRKVNAQREGVYVFILAKTLTSFTQYCV